MKQFWRDEWLVLLGMFVMVVIGTISGFALWTVISDGQSFGGLDLLMIALIDALLAATVWFSSRP